MDLQLGIYVTIDISIFSNKFGENRMFVAFFTEKCVFPILLRVN